MVLLWLGICQSVKPDFFLEFHVLVMSPVVFAPASPIAIAPASMAEYLRNSLLVVIYTKFA